MKSPVRPRGGRYFYRVGEPTNDFVAAKIAELEGGTAAMLTSSARLRTSSPCSTSPARAIMSQPARPSTAARATCWP
ncbi:MAG: hypothetical protein ACLTMP_04935 [Eggerthella lenta]